MASNELIGKKIHIAGIVQGVGFRPFIYGLAQKHHISGWVRNSSAGVDIVANGSHGALEAFIDDIRHNPPPLANIDQIEVTTVQPDGFSDFRIIESSTVQGGFIPVSADMSICPDCLRELFDPDDRRYRYPFINCTNCGPRFTIIKDIPYDRPLTTMADFALCPQCESEYHDPLDRRFHAQPVACADCGPHVWFETDGETHSEGEDAIQTAAPGSEMARSSPSRVWAAFIWPVMLPTRKLSVNCADANDVLKNPLRSWSLTRPLLKDTAT